MSERIGPYVIESRIGMGGMGIVYAAHDEALNRRVALKVISPQFADDAEFRARFIREARAMASLHSPHVVSVFAHGETEGQLWMATQFFPDGDLGSVLRRSGPPSLPDAIELIAQVADGLSAAHESGLVHRDIKPANVLLRRNGLTWNAAIADFGIARAGADQTGLTQGGMVGTPSFMAPELHTGAVASVASDIYAMGCLLWTTLSGTAPYVGTTDYEIVTAHLAKPIPQLDATTPLAVGVNAVLRRAMTKDAGSRYRDAATFRDELLAVLHSANEGPTAVRRAVDRGPSAQQPDPQHPDPQHPDPQRPDPQRPAPLRPLQGDRARRPVLVVVAAIAAVVMVAGLGWTAVRLWPQGQEKGPEKGEGSTAGPREAPTTGGASKTPDRKVDGYTRSDRAKAQKTFVAALVTQPAITAEVAECLASEILAGDGLQRMVDAGFFDKRWNYVDGDLGPYPEMKQQFTTATLTCTAG